jgi:hypothetical protein
MVGLAGVLEPGDELVFCYAFERAVADKRNPVTFEVGFPAEIKAGDVVELCLRAASIAFALVVLGKIS